MIQMKKRGIYPSGLFHVFNRGSKKELLFFEEKDYRRFLQRLFEYSSQTGDKIVQYCILPNHFHLLIRANEFNSISKLMLKLQTSHARYLTTKYGLVGRIYQSRYKCKSIESDLYLKVVSRYIHRNPIDYFNSERAVKDYPWSSYQLFFSKKTSEVKSQFVLEHFKSILEYKEFIESDEITAQKYYKSAALYSRGVYEDWV